MQIIEEIANEGSSFFPTIEFFDELNVAMTPDTLFWDLTDLAGNIINERERIEVSSPGTSLTLALTGDDLDAMGDDVATRILNLYGTYTSSVHGSGMTFLFQAQFSVKPKVGG